MLTIDANVILRYILDDNEKLSPKARDIIDGNDFHVPIEVLAEVVYVLSGVYEIERDEIKRALTEFVESTKCDLDDADVVAKSLEVFSESSIDFVDCVLAARAACHGIRIATFDKKLNKLIGKQPEEK
jgi:predicted nucleic-acid-binding protein